MENRAGKDFTLVVENLCHDVALAGGKKKRILHDVSFTLHAGEFVALLGTNGSGKSTLARHCNALLLPTEGHCLVAGMDTLTETELWKIRAQVSMVFQNPDNQIVAAVVEDDIAFGPENLGVPSAEIRQRVSEALRAVGMEHCRKLAPHLLSGGQKQRVAIAGALATQASCLVLDEPTAMLDPQGRAEVMQTVQKLAKEEGIAILLITHYMEEAALADRVLVLNGGKVVRTGSPREVFQEVDFMESLGLTVPLAVRLAYHLRAQGISLPADILTESELVQALCPSS